MLTVYRLIYRIRKGQNKNALKQCKVIFAASNSSLCQAASDFFAKKEGYIEQGALPITITIHSLTKVLWFKKPMSTPDLPREYVITECYAAIKPGDSLCNRYLEKDRAIERERWVLGGAVLIALKLTIRVSRTFRYQHGQQRDIYKWNPRGKFYLSNPAFFLTFFYLVFLLVYCTREITL